jgi:hypothetical protein
MLPFGVTIPATVSQWSEIPEGLMNNPVYSSTTGLSSPLFSPRYMSYSHIRIQSVEEEQYIYYDTDNTTALPFAMVGINIYS